MGKKQVLSIWIEPEQLEAIRALSRRTRVPMAVFYRDAIDAVIEKNAELLKKKD